MNIKRFKPVAIVLGGTIAHIALINNLKSRGFYVILIDNTNPLARYYSDKFIQESTMDFEAVLEIAKRFNAELVISAAVDQANLVACKVAEKIGLKIPYSLETANIVTNKQLMKETLIKLGITTSKFNINNSCGLKFPLMVKPVDSCASKGVVKVKNDVELKAAFDTARAHCRRKMDVVCEDFVSGQEFAFVYFADNTCHLLRVYEKCFFNNIHVLSKPTNVSQKTENEMLEIANNICKSLNIKNTIIFFQCIVSDEKISIIEFAPRIPGGPLSYWIIDQVSGLDTMNLMVNSYLNISNNVEISHKEDCYYISNVYAVPGVFGSVYKSRHVDTIESFILKESGDEIKHNEKVVIMCFRSENNYKEKLKDIISDMEIYDMNNSPVMIRDIYD